MIAGALAIGRAADLRAAWTELLGSRVCDLRRLLRGRWPYRMSDIVGSVATRYFGKRLLSDTRIPLAVVVTQLRTRGFSRRVLTERDSIPLADAILASCFLPGPYSRMVPIDRRLTFDGAWLCRVPIDAAVVLGARRVIACVSDDDGRLLRGAWWPRIVAAPADVDYRVLSPVVPLPVRSFDFERHATFETFAIGQESARLFVDRNREWLKDGRFSRSSVAATASTPTPTSRPTGV